MSPGWFLLLAFTNASMREIYCSWFRGSVNVSTISIFFRNLYRDNGNLIKHLELLSVKFILESFSYFLKRQNQVILKWKKKKKKAWKKKKKEIVLAEIPISRFRISTAWFLGFAFANASVGRYIAHNLVAVGLLVHFSYFCGIYLVTMAI